MNININWKKAFWLVLDVLFINLGIIAAFWARFGWLQVSDVYINTYMRVMPVYTIIMLAVFYVFGLYDSLWRYASVDDMVSITLATGLGTAINMAGLYLITIRFPRSIYLLSWLFTLLLVGSSRLIFRGVAFYRPILSREPKQQNKVLIVGAGEAGAMVIKELKKHRELGMVPVAIIDDDDNKQHGRLHGVPVLGRREDIAEIARELHIDQIIIAIPSASRDELRSILDECKKTRCRLKIMPGVYEVINGDVTINQIRDVKVEDLLGRAPVELDTQSIAGYLTNAVVLITGGGGSIGSELCRQIARFNPKQLLIFDIYENGAYDVQNELKIHYPSLDLKVLIGSIRDRARLDSIFEQYKPDVVFHAAAHKHVPLMEENPTEAIKNNVFGTLNVAEMADKHGAKRFVLISTDKAVNPTNVMGATKRVAEMLIQAMAKHSNTIFAAVRFGNVLGSNGSVIPLFKRQIAEGGPVTVTHPDITRYFMTIPEAAQLVIQAGAMAHGGEIFVLDMGQPVKILDLARDLIKLSGLEPDKDIKIEFTGLRPGEKLYEELLMAEEGLQATKHKKIYIAQPADYDIRLLKEELEKLRFILLGNGDEIVDFLGKLVPTYRRAANN
ncbi:polysaccharide biosynthesis protein [Mahella australiensis]|uniref:Polysaccharide biosynthesis protein CapD n=1 Tax=Mahella australiensis (strain DSM 15567 / CIP 107919 / 50-1 BON) TaxID=697281 RepID=F3ZXN0_MAHA5|nr:nucleoside-diphosphate sugar epimerase/dehydratase [Mahella australiensis]AEE95537.1 polysaccharide biosynthesis protein CapD [Mahella australiensis 50-1 BON]